MTKELLPGLLAVEVSANIYDAFIGGGDTPFCERPDDEYLCVRHDGSGTNIALPPGTWSILGIGTADKITEQEWAGVVESKRKKGGKFNAGIGHYQSSGWTTYYKNYQHPSPSICIPNTATESGLTLLKLHNLNPSTTVLLTNKK